MNIAALAFISGIAWVQQWTRLPNTMEWFLILVVFLSLSLLRCRIGGFLLLGIIWASAYAGWRLSDRLSDEWQGKDVVVQGYIASLPKQQENRSSFDFIVTRAPEGIPGKLRLNWYAPRTRLGAGQGWEMTVRLKKPHGRFNPGGFDYEAWLFANHIGASGYVRAKPPPRVIAAPFAFKRYTALWRQTIADRLGLALQDDEQLGIITALSVGAQGAISRQQWDIFRTTGTVHLMVISGTHISLITGLVFLLVRGLWARTGILYFSPQTVAAVTAWLAAVIYVGLAGFTIPTQRALVMLTVALLAIIWQRNTAPLYVLQLALLAVVLFDPLAMLSLGFWLSFAAVALLMYISAGRLGKASFWRETTKLHVCMAIGLAPLLIVFFQQASLIAPLANWIAVPVIGLLITPLALLAAVISLFSPVTASLLLWPADIVLQGIVYVLKQMASWPMAMVTCPQPSWYELLFATLGIILLLAPKGVPGRYLSPILFLPLIFGQAERPRPGEVWLTLLDVGQGLATVLETSNHVLIYDTGPKYSDQSDMGEAVVLPFLRYRNIGNVDALMISHGENDHSGGAASVLAGIGVDKTYSSAAAWVERTHGRYCRAGQGWRWDDVSFEILSPGEQSFDSENDHSCVLKVSTDARSLLLAGDIEHRAEQWLVKRYGRRLASSILIAPHHGSDTSSRGYFLDQVSPELILISAGYLNRFGFPARRVIQRYHKRHIPYLTTGGQGAITVKLADDAIRVESYRQRRKRYWMEDG